MPELGDQDVEPAYKQLMISIVEVLDEMFNGKARGQERETGFVLLVFPFHGHEGRCNYMSNGADRKDIVALFKEQIKRFEGAPDQQGHA